MKTMNFTVTVPTKENITSIQVSSEGILVISFLINGLNNVKRINIKNEKKIIDIFGPNDGVKIISNARQILATKGVYV
jgi:hypothetical protein